jgi:hypothetical protein
MDCQVSSISRIPPYFHCKEDLPYYLLLYCLAELQLEVAHKILKKIMMYFAWSNLVSGLQQNCVNRKIRDRKSAGGTSFILSKEVNKLNPNKFHNKEVSQKAILH